MEKDKLVNWVEQKSCTDIGDYELTVEMQKTDWNCEQNYESWKWSVDYHGSIVASGTCTSLEEARQMAIANTPKPPQEGDSGAGASL